MTYLHHPYEPDRHRRLYRLLLLLVLSLGAWGWSQVSSAAEPTHVAACFADEPSGTPVFNGSGYSVCATSWVSTALSEVTADTRILVMPSLTATDEEKLFQRAGDVNSAWCSWDPAGAGDFCPFADYWTAGEDPEDPEDPEECQGENWTVACLDSARMAGMWSAGFSLVLTAWLIGFAFTFLLNAIKRA